MASRALSTAASDEYSFAMAASFLNGSECSSREAASSRQRQAGGVRAHLHVGELDWMTWLAPIVRPKARRVPA
ncbi:hypothetical protein GCM10020229_82640 [Kitasatospora albolonga]